MAHIGIVKEVIAWGGALVAIAQAQVPASGMPDLGVIVSTLGVPGAVMGVLIWIIRDERADKKEMREAFQKTIEQLSKDAKESREKSDAVLTRMVTAVERLDTKLDGLDVLRDIERKLEH